MAAGLCVRIRGRTGRSPARPRGQGIKKGDPHSMGMTSMGISWGFNGIFCYPLVNVYITMERSTMLLMGKLTISTGPFSIANCWHNQRAIHEIERFMVKQSDECGDEADRKTPFVIDCWDIFLGKHAHLPTVFLGKPASPVPFRAGGWWFQRHNFF